MIARNRWRQGRVAMVGAIWLALVITWVQGASAALENEMAADDQTQSAVLETIQRAVEGEKAQNEELAKRIDRLRLVRESLQTELSAYRFQLTTHNNLLLIPQVVVEDLEKAVNNSETAVSVIEERLKTFQDRLQSIQLQQQKTQEQLALTQERLAEIRASQRGGADTEFAVMQISALKGHFQTSMERLQELERGYLEEVRQLESMQKQLTETAGRLADKLRDRKKTQRFERTPLPIEQLDAELLKTEFILLSARVFSVFTVRFWASELKQFLKSGVVAHVSFFVFALLTVLFFRRCKRYCLKIEKALKGEREVYRHTALRLLVRSLMPLAVLLLLYVYDALRFVYYGESLVHLLSRILLVFLIVRWGKDFLHEWMPESPTPLQAIMSRRSKQMLNSFRLVMIGYLILAWLTGFQGVLEASFRLLFNLGVIIWLFFFWKSVETFRDERKAAVYATIRVFSYLGPGLTLLLDLSGYTPLSRYWGLAWGKMVAVLFWAWLLFKVIEEWKADSHDLTAPATPDASPVRSSLRWMLVQGAYLIWGIGLTAGALLAWSEPELLFTWIRALFDFTFSIGSIRLNIHGIFSALFLLFLTFMISRLARHLLGEKILDQERMERGLVDSIITISSYLVWAVGIVLALGVLGVSTTSLAVVFGALSIGIGFGLQNIFNNFISGLILLFERPIQVGDYVEINGQWAEVKKINVRATVVQTFDNASLIIPNSEFISNQVTNWSFKDPRMRRQVDIGVAYGSDVERVRQTLLEIAGDTEGVYKFPRPDVLFMDHGDSALIFRLRYWTHVDQYFSTSTAIRFAIDRRFKELGIEIAFPQMDIHIRSIVQKDGPGKTVLEDVAKTVEVEP